MLDRTLVVVMSELGRTPTYNENLGKEHWPTTSALLIGGPLVGGRTIGATDDGLNALPVDLDTGAVDSDGQPLRYDNLAAGMLEMAQWITGFVPELPVELVKAGEPFWAP